MKYIKYIGNVGDFDLFSYIEKSTWLKLDLEDYFSKDTKKQESRKSQRL